MRLAKLQLCLLLEQITHPPPLAHSLRAQSSKGTCGDLDALANAQLVVFSASMLLQVWRWLFLRREFSRAQDNKSRAMRLAVTAVVVGLIEDIPQAVIAFAVASSCPDGLSWRMKISLAVGFTTTAWKLLTPLLLRFDFLEGRGVYRGYNG